MNFASLLACIVTCVAIALAGVEPLLAGGVALIWIGSLWLSRPEQTFRAETRNGNSVEADHIAPFLEGSSLPLLLVARDRIVAANNAARLALGAHVTGQDPRIALRHPQAVQLLGGDAPGAVTIKGLTTPRSLWELRLAQVDDRYRVIELSDLSSQSDQSRAHTDFVANASHELRTPLAAIIGYVETLADEKSRIDPPTQQRFLGIVEREARRMATLVEDLMSLSRIEAEKHELPRDRIDLAALAAAAAKDVDAIQGRSRVMFENAASDAHVAGEHAQLDQLIRNLIDNAIKYGDSDAPVTLRIEDAPRDRVLLSVSDRGPGIAADHIPHLTRRFYRTDPGRSRASGGTGLGLAIVKHIVERHRGQLDIASKLGEGTRVAVSLPRVA